MQKAIVVKGLVLILISIVLGAFAAHYLETKLSIKALSSFQVGVRYQMYGGLLLLIFGIKKEIFNNNNGLINTFFIGNILFCFSIYYLSLTLKTNLDKVVGPITPLGGLLMILALIILLIRIIKNNK